MTSHSQQAAERFDRWAKTYGTGRISRWFQHYQGLALARLDLKGGDGFLDVGCGSGWAVNEAAKQLRTGPCCGIDISPRMIERAKELASDSTTLTFEIGDAEKIDYPDGAFHSILCSNSFHHYGNPKKALLELRRVLSPEGTLVILDPARDLFFPIWLQDRWRRYFEQSHVRYYTRAELQALLNATGWRIDGEIATFKRMFDHGKLFTGLMLVSCRRLLQ